LLADELGGVSGFTRATQLYEGLTVGMVWM
jgi:hypothetical protein